MKNKIILISALLAGLFILSSCLKDDDFDYWKDDVAGKMYATVFSPGFHSKSIQPVADVVEFEFMLNIATDKLPKTDVVINLALDNAAISAYDSTLKAAAKDAKKFKADGVTLDWKNYRPFPSIELVDQVVTIPAGSRTGTCRVRVARADTVLMTNNYMLAVTITSASPSNIQLTSNMKTYLLALPIANKWEGLYSNDGYFKHPTVASCRALTADKELLTVDPSTVSLGLADLEDPTTGDYYINVKIDEDPTHAITVNGRICNPVTITSTGTNPAGFSQTDVADDLISFDSGVRFNYYDPTTKTFVLRYHYNTSAYREIQEVLTLKK